VDVRDTGLRDGDRGAMLLACRGESAGGVVGVTTPPATCVGLNRR
jgi:hypothetical protein